MLSLTTIIYFAHSFDIRYIVEKVFKVDTILEDTTDKDKEEDKKYKKITFKLKVPHAPGYASDAKTLKKTQELTFNLFLDQPNCSKILVYESGAQSFHPLSPPPPSPIFRIPLHLLLAFYCSLQDSCLRRLACV